jgi:hypothetical protein
MSAPNTMAPASSPTNLDDEATSYMVKINDRWRVKIVNNKTGQVIWSQQDYATREECQAEFDKAMDEMGIEHQRYQ